VQVLVLDARDDKDESVVRKTKFYEEPTYQLHFPFISLPLQENGFHESEYRISEATVGPKPQKTASMRTWT